MLYVNGHQKQHAENDYEGGVALTGNYNFAFAA